jgi:hypothetical protein
MHRRRGSTSSNVRYDHIMLVVALGRDGGGGSEEAYVSGWSLSYFTALSL